MKLESLKSINKDVLDKSSLGSITGGKSRTEYSSGGTHNGESYSTDTRHYTTYKDMDGNTHWNNHSGTYSKSDAQLAPAGATLYDLKDMN